MPDDQPPAEEVPIIDATPVRHPFKRKKHRNGEKIVDPATKAEAKKNLDKLVAEAVEKVVTGDPVLGAVAEKTLSQSLSLRARAQVLAVLGEDIEQARTYFADQLLATAHKIVGRIDREVEDLPASSLGFLAAVMVDKSEQLRNKTASNPQNAQVNIQVNQFGDGSIDRQAIIDKLTGFVPKAGATEVKAEEAK